MCHRTIFSNKSDDYRSLTLARLFLTSIRYYFCCPNYYIYVVVGYKQLCICLMLNTILYCIILYISKHQNLFKKKPVTASLRQLEKFYEKTNCQIAYVVLLSRYNAYPGNREQIHAVIPENVFL